MFPIPNVSRDYNPKPFESPQKLNSTLVSNYTLHSDLKIPTVKKTLF